MLKKIRSQSGFSAFEAILIVVALIAIGAAGYFAWQARQDKTDYSVSVLKSQKKSEEKATSASSSSAKVSLSQAAEQAVLDGWYQDYTANNTRNSAYATASYNQSFSNPTYNACHHQSAPQGLKASASGRAQTGDGTFKDSQVQWYSSDPGFANTRYEYEFVYQNGKWLINKATNTSC